MRVGVLFGGCSSEKEISLESGRHIYNSLDSSKYEIIPIYVDWKLRFWRVPERLLWMNATADIEKAVETDPELTRIKYEELKNQIDFALLGLHGKYVEDGSLQGLLELQQIPYNGPRVLGAALGMDKIFQKHIFRAAGLKYAPHVTTTSYAFVQNPDAVVSAVENAFGYPCIVKPSREGCSTGISKVNDRAGLKPAVEFALQWDDAILIEKFLDAMEVTCTVMGNASPRALTPTETPSKGAFLTLEEKFLPGDAQMLTPPRVPPEDVEKMQAEFVKAYKALNLCVYSRIDGFWDTKEKVLYINEPNTLPGVTPSTHVFHQAAEDGMSPSDFFDRIIELSLEEHREKRSQS